MITVDESILIWALRYAIGRQTYAPHDVITAIRTNFDMLSDNTLQVLLRDIKEASSWGHESIDASAWKRLQDDLVLRLSND